MLKQIIKNYNILTAAVGEEPIMQIIVNGIRKIFNIPPVLNKSVLHKTQNSSYDRYLQARDKILASRPVHKTSSDAILCILIDISIEKDLQEAYECLQKQRLKPLQVILVSVDKTIEGVKRYSSIQDAINSTSSDYIMFMQSNLTIHTACIQEFDFYLNDDSNIDIFYACHDYIVNRKRGQPQWLPQLNTHLLYCYNYIGNTLLVKRSVGDRLSWFRKDQFPNAYIYDFILRGIDEVARFYRIPDVLISYKDGITYCPIDERKLIIKEHLDRIGCAGKVIGGIVENTLRVKWVVNNYPLVSIIVPFRDKVNLLKACLESIVAKTEYPNYEIILADNRSQEKETRSYIDKMTAQYQNIKHISIDMDFNFSAINNYAVSKCEGELLLFLNNDTEVISSNWLSEMVMELQGPKVGAVGAKLLYADDTVQHAGVLYGVGHVAGHAFRHLRDKDNGHMNRANLVQEYLAVTGACLLTNRNLFNIVGGFDAVNLAIAYNDVDICLDLYNMGYKIVYTPFSKMFHFESKSRENDISKKEINRYHDECTFMYEKWGEVIEFDPFHHVYMDKRKEDFSISENFMS